MYGRKLDSVLPSRDNIGISHLFFADDLMLLAKASEDDYQAIMEVLECFRAVSG